MPKRFDFREKIQNIQFVYKANELINHDVQWENKRNSTVFSLKKVNNDIMNFIKFNLQLPSLLSQDSMRGNFTGSDNTCWLFALDQFSSYCSQVYILFCVTIRSINKFQGNCGIMTNLGIITRLSAKNCCYPIIFWQEILLSCFYCRLTISHTRILYRDLQARALIGWPRLCGSFPPLPIRKKSLTKPYVR